MTATRTALVTGANAGIGYETALALAKLGMTTLLVCRDAQRGEVARQQIAAAAGHQRVVLFQCDLADQAAIVELAAEVGRRTNQLDVLVNNAGAILESRQESPQGVEMTMAVNHLAPFLLTNLLRPLLRAGNAPRVVIVSSEAHRLARLDWADLMVQRRYRPLTAYADSKLANILFTKSLAEKWRADGITANCLHPGVVGSNFGGSAKGLFFRAMLSLAKPFMITPRQGAATSVYLASDPAVGSQTGLYFDKQRPKVPSEKAQSQYNAQRLWEESARLTGLETQ